jgi:hypothetical protein
MDLRQEIPPHLAPGRRQLRQDNLSPPPQIRRNQRARAATDEGLGYRDDELPCHLRVEYMEVSGYATYTFPSSVFRFTFYIFVW